MAAVLAEWEPHSPAREPGADEREVGSDHRTEHPTRRPHHDGNGQAQLHPRRDKEARALHRRLAEMRGRHRQMDRGRAYQQHGQEPAGRFGAHPVGCGRGPLGLRRDQRIRPRTIEQIGHYVPPVKRDRGARLLASGSARRPAPPWPGALRDLPRRPRPCRHRRRRRALPSTRNCPSPRTARDRSPPATGPCRCSREHRLGVTAGAQQHARGGTGGHAIGDHRHAVHEHALNARGFRV